MIRGFSVLKQFLVLVVIYFATVFAIPADADTLHKYHISAAQLHALDAVLVVPLLIILAAAFYGYARLKEYADIIKDSEDGRQISLLANGIGVIAYGLIISGIISNTLNAFAVHHRGLKVIEIILSNYIGIAYLGAALFLISIGTKGLMNIAKYRPSLRAIHGLVGVLIIIAVIYTYFIFENPRSTLWSIFHLPLWLIVTTIVIPYIYLWFAGLLASFELLMYTKRLRGLIYKQSWRWVALGLGLIMIMEITLQFLNALTSGYSSLTIKALFFAALLIFIVMAIAFLMIAKGARGLRKIEG